MGSKFPPRPRGASYLCRARMAQDFLNTVHIGNHPLLSVSLSRSAGSTYSEMKAVVGGSTAAVKRSARNALGGWATNDGDGEFTLSESLSQT